MDFERQWKTRLEELEALDPAQVPALSEEVVRELDEAPELAQRLEAVGEGFFALLTERPRRALAEVALAEAYARRHGQARLSDHVLRRATAQFMLGCSAAAIEATGSELARLGRAGSANERLALLTLRAQALIARGELRPALIALEEALALARAQPRQPMLGVVLSAFGNARLHGGDLESAAEYYREALERGRAQGQTEGEAVNLGNLGLVHFLRGEYPAAEACYDEALALLGDALDRRAATVVEANLGLLAGERGDLAQAQTLLLGALSRSQGAGDGPRARHCLVRLARISREGGDYAAAAKRLAEAGPAEAVSPQPADAPQPADLAQVELEQESARLALARGEPALALGHAQASGRSASGLNYASGVAHGQLAEARAYLALGRAEEARRAALAAREAGRELGQPLLRGWAALTLAEASAQVPGAEAEESDGALAEAGRALPREWLAAGWLELAQARIAAARGEGGPARFQALAARARGRGWGELAQAAERAEAAGASGP